jgi:hypothetical protein
MGYDLEKDKASPTDLCVMCGADTRILKKTPVYTRPYYVEGAGQLCEEHYENAYGQLFKSAASVDHRLN